MSDRHEGEPGFDTNLDLARPDTLDENEAARLVEWYEKSHGAGNIELTPFVPFLIEQRPGALKRYRAYPQAIHDSCGLPQAAVALIWLHHYMVIRNANGIAYQVIAARAWGASKVEVLDVVELTFLEAGPLGLNAVADKAAEYLKSWPDDEPRQVENPWPEGWEPAAPGANVLGIDLADPELTRGDRTAVNAWYESRDRAAPSYVSFLGDRVPTILKAMLGRYEHALRDSSIPAPLIPLLHLHTAAIEGDTEGARAAASEARAAGVSAPQALGTLAFAFLYMTSAKVESAVTALEDLFVDWA